jgi:hypothetical protein
MRKGKVLKMIDLKSSMFAHFSLPKEGPTKKKCLPSENVLGKLTPAALNMCNSFSVKYSQFEVMHSMPSYVTKYAYASEEQLSKVVDKVSQSLGFTFPSVEDRSDTIEYLSLLVPLIWYQTITSCIETKFNRTSARESKLSFPTKVDADDLDILFANETKEFNSLKQSIDIDPFKGFFTIGNISLSYNTHLYLEFMLHDYVNIHAKALAPQISDSILEPSLACYLTNRVYTLDAIPAVEKKIRATLRNSIHSENHLEALRSGVLYPRLYSTLNEPLISTLQHINYSTQAFVNDRNMFEKFAILLNHLGSIREQVAFFKPELLGDHQAFTDFTSQLLELMVSLSKEFGPTTQNFNNTKAKIQILIETIDAAAKHMLEKREYAKFKATILAKFTLDDGLEILSEYQFTSLCNKAYKILHLQYNSLFNSVSETERTALLHPADLLLCFLSHADFNKSKYSAGSLRESAKKSEIPQLTPKAMKRFVDILVCKLQPHNLQDDEAERLEESLALIAVCAPLVRWPLVNEDERLAFLDAKDNAAKELFHGFNACFLDEANVETINFVLRNWVPVDKSLLVRLQEETIYFIYRLLESINLSPSPKLRSTTSQIRFKIQEQTINSILKSEARKVLLCHSINVPTPIYSWFSIRASSSILTNAAHINTTENGELLPLTRPANVTARPEDYKSIRYLFKTLIDGYVLPINFKDDRYNLISITPMQQQYSFIKMHETFIGHFVNLAQLMLSAYSQEPPLHKNSQLYQFFKSYYTAALDEKTAVPAPFTDVICKEVEYRHMRLS